MFLLSWYFTSTETVWFIRMFLRFGSPLIIRLRPRSCAILAHAGTARCVQGGSGGGGGGGGGGGTISASTLPHCEEKEQPFSALVGLARLRAGPWAWKQPPPPPSGWWAECLALRNT